MFGVAPFAAVLSGVASFALVLARSSSVSGAPHVEQKQCGRDCFPNYMYIAFSLNL